MKTKAFLGRALLLGTLSLATFCAQAKNVLLVGAGMSQYQSYLTSSNHTSTVILETAFGSASFAGYDAIWLREGVFFTGLLLRSNDLVNFAQAGGSVLFEMTSIQNALTDYPFGGELSSIVADGDTVHITDAGDPFNAGLTDAGLSNWGITWHSRLTSKGSLDALQDDTIGGWITVKKNVGSGRVTFTCLHLAHEQPNGIRFFNNVVAFGNITLAISSQPASQTVVVSSNATFTVSAAGVSPFAYQWFLAGSPISGGTNSSLTLSNVTFANQGGYSVIVTNTYGSVTSSVATLTVQSLTVANADALGTAANAQLQTPAFILLTNDVAGSVNGSNSNLIIHSVSATSSNGGTVSLVYTQAWVGRYDGAAHLGDQVLAAVSDSGGNVIVVGITGPANGLSDWLVAKYAPDGTQLWTDTHNGPANTADAATAVAADGAGNIYVIGHSYQAGTSQDYFTRKYAPNGTLLWEQRRDGGIGSDDFPRAVAVDSGTNVYVTGYSTGSGTGYDIYTVKYSPAGGFQWADRFHGALGDDLGNAIAIDSSDNVFVAGNSRNINNDDDLAVLKLTPGGTRLWSRTLNRGRGRAVAVDANGNVVVTGTQTPVGTPDNFAIVKWDGNGTALWTNLFDGPVAGNDDGRAIAVGNDGSIFAGGLATTATGLDFVLFRLNSNGTRVWTNFYNAYGYSDVMTALKLDAFGRIYVSGYSETPPGTTTEITTLAYWPDGQAISTNRFNPNSTNGHAALAVAPDLNGGWAVAGNANQGGSGNDAATVKFAPYVYYTPPTNFQGTDSFTYVVQDVAGMTTTGTVAVTVVSPPVILTQTGDVGIECGSGNTTNLSVNATGSAPLTYRWYLNGVFHADTGTTNSLAGVNEVWAGFPMNPAPYTCVVSNDYGATTSSVMLVSRVDTTPPVITSGLVTNIWFQPCNTPFDNYYMFGSLAATDCSSVIWSQSVVEGGFGVGSPGTTNTVRITARDSYNNASYFDIQVVSASTPPTTGGFSQHPLSVVTNLGASVYFCAPFESFCGQDFIVQWYKDGVPIPEATNGCHIIPSASLAEVGVYQAFATNILHYGPYPRYGSSAIAMLTIAAPPTVDPLTTRLVYGSDGVSLVANGSGPGPLSYQWRLNGTNILGATGGNYTTGTGSPGNAGNYDVVICNPYGCVTSSVVAASFFGDLKFYAGAVLAGGVGSQYRVDYADVIGGITNIWQTLTTVTLPYSPYLVIDPYSPTQAVRFYRAVPLP